MGAGGLGGTMRTCRHAFLEAQDLHVRAMVMLYQ